MLLNSLTNIFESLTQYLEAYFRDPVFNKTVRDLGKRKKFWRDTGFDRFWRRLAEILARDVVLGKKTVFRLALQTEVRDEGLAREKGARMQVQGPPFQALSTPSREDVSEGVSDLEIPLKFRLIFDQLIIEGSCLRDL